MVELDWHVLLVQALSFLITFWIVKRYGWVPIQNMLAGRAETIRHDYEQAEGERRKMEDLRREYEQKIASADAEARSRIKASVDRAEETARTIVAQAQEEAKATAERSRAEMERERQKVLAELRGQVAHLSVAIASKIVDEHIDERKHQQLIDDFITRLGTLS